MWPALSMTKPEPSDCCCSCCGANGFPKSGSCGTVKDARRRDLHDARRPAAVDVVDRQSLAGANEGRTFARAATTCSTVVSCRAGRRAPRRRAPSRRPRSPPRRREELRRGPRPECRSSRHLSIRGGVKPRLRCKMFSCRRFTSCARLFLLDPDVVFLNHGSFGACPRPVFEEYQRLQLELEREPVEFLSLKRRFPELIGDARERLAAYVGASRVRSGPRPERDDGGERRRALARPPARRRDRLDDARVRRQRPALAVHVRAPRRALRRDRHDARRARSTICSERSHRGRARSSSATSRLRPHCAFPSRSFARGRATPACSRSSTARMRPGRSRSTSARSAPTSTPATATSGCARRRAQGSCTRAARCSRCSSRSQSAGTGRPAKWAERFRWTGTHDPAPHLAVPAAIDFQADARLGRGARALPRPRRARRARAERRSAWSRCRRATTSSCQMVAVRLPPCDAEALTVRLFREHRIEVLAQTWRGQPIAARLVPGLQRRERPRRAVDGAARRV